LLNTERVDEGERRMAMQARVKNLSRTVRGALDGAEEFGAGAITARVPETMLYQQRLAGLLIREG
jgi:hypothetical protein